MDVEVRGVDRNAGRHRGVGGVFLDVGALGGGWLHFAELVDEGVGVGGEVVIGEGKLADDGVDVATRIVAEFDFAGGVFLDRGRDVRGDGAGLGGRHLALGSGQ